MHRHFRKADRGIGLGHPSKATTDCRVPVINLSHVQQDSRRCDLDITVDTSPPSPMPMDDVLPSIVNDISAWIKAGDDDYPNATPPSPINSLAFYSTVLTCTSPNASPIAHPYHSKLRIRACTSSPDTLLTPTQERQATTISESRPVHDNSCCYTTGGDAGYDEREDEGLPGQVVADMQLYLAENEDKPTGICSNLNG